MKKWYENPLVDEGIIISSRVRLARNIKKYPFSTRISDEQAIKMIEEVKNAVLNTAQAEAFTFTAMGNIGYHQKLSLMERHIISPVLVEKKQPCGVLINEDETVNILLNEEDHLRIQAVYPGEQIDEAWKIANCMDDFIEEQVEYAYDEEFGYLTACPTNVGTGLRASYMMHLPALEKAGQMQNVMEAVNKFGITVRGTYGEGTEALGSIYQISNQVSLGKSEEEIILNLKKVANLVIEQEKKMRDAIIQQHKDDFEDMIYRSYGILTNARKISAKEAMEYLSGIRQGFLLGLFAEKKPKSTLYQMMIEMQSGCLQTQYDNQMNTDKRDHIRAKYIREQFQ